MVGVLHGPIINSLHISRASSEAAAATEAQEIEPRERLCRGERPSIAVENNTMVLIDDGLATRSTTGRFGGNLKLNPVYGSMGIYGHGFVLR